jgi:hypothetical protein
MLKLRSLPLLALALAAGVETVTGEPVAKLDCIVMNAQGLESRPSPLDSISFEVAGAVVKICYGRPSAKGRTMIGGDAAPYGSLWRTGANEPSMIHTSTALSVAGVEIEPGSYSLYTIPGEKTWQVIVNRSITQWGHEGRYTDEIKGQEVGRGTVPSERMDDHVETFTLRAESTADGVTLLLEWENTRVMVPIKPAS